METIKKFDEFINSRNNEVKQEEVKNNVEQEIKQEVAQETQVQEKAEPSVKEEVIEEQVVENPTEQRSISYGEIVELQSMFDAQVEGKHIIWENDEQLEQALFDFIQQYIDGNDTPEIRVL